MSDVTAEAKALVDGDRQAKYGHPIDNFQRIADFWTTWLRERLTPGARVDVRDVGPMMTLLKLAREMHEHDVDNARDGSGYLYCHELIHEELALREAIHGAPPADMTESTTVRRRVDGWVKVVPVAEPHVAPSPGEIPTECARPCARPECPTCATAVAVGCRTPGAHAPIWDGQSTSRPCGCPLVFPSVDVDF